MIWLTRAGIVLGIVAFIVLTIVFVLFYQGRQRPVVRSPYVALGSSFAAGLGLGARVPGSPFVCQRSDNGYPRHLARLLDLPLTDMTCSGATITQVLRGGQMFQGPQVAAIGPGTRLVTITAGGNDVGYVGDMTAMAFRRRGGIKGFVAGRSWSGARPIEARGLDALGDDMRAMLRDVRLRAPEARIVVVTYPDILPPAGTCTALGIDAQEADMMRPVGAQLADLTRAVAQEGGALLIDAAALSAGHEACSARPWVNGASPEQGAPFHPTLAGAQAIAAAVADRLQGRDSLDNLGKVRDTALAGVESGIIVAVEHLLSLRADDGRSKTQAPRTILR